MRNKTVSKLTLLAIGLVWSSFAFGHTSFPTKVKCPIDGEIFTINVTASYTVFNTLKDFQKQGAIGDLYESMINSCPKCHYSGYQDDFDTTFTETTKQDILLILDPYRESIMTNVLENEIAVKINLYFKRNNDVIANLYLYASYFLKNDSSQIVKRKELQQNAAIYFINAIENKEYEEEASYATINYLIGELYRRIGDFDNAIEYYDLAINDEKKKDWVLLLATEQKELALKKDEDNSI